MIDGEEGRYPNTYNHALKRTRHKAARRLAVCVGLHGRPFLTLAEVGDE